MIPNDEFNRLLSMAKHQGWYATSQHRIRLGYSYAALASILTAALWEGQGIAEFQQKCYNVSR